MVGPPVTADAHTGTGGERRSARGSQALRSQLPAAPPGAWKRLAPPGKGAFPLGRCRPSWALRALGTVQSWADTRWIRAALQPQRSAHRSSLVLKRKQERPRESTVFPEAPLPV